MGNPYAGIRQLKIFSDALYAKKKLTNAYTSKNKETFLRAVCNFSEETVLDHAPFAIRYSKPGNVITSVLKDFEEFQKTLDDFLLQDFSELPASTPGRNIANMTTVSLGTADEEMLLLLKEDAAQHDQQISSTTDDHRPLHVFLDDDDDDNPLGHELGGYLDDCINHLLEGENYESQNLPSLLPAPGENNDDTDDDDDDDDHDDDAAYLEVLDFALDDEMDDDDDDAVESSRYLSALLQPVAVEAQAIQPKNNGPTQQRLRQR